MACGILRPAMELPACESTKENELGTAWITCVFCSSGLLASSRMKEQPIVTRSQWGR